MKEIKTTLKDYLQDFLKPEELEKINRSFEVVGDIAITEIPEELDKYDKKIGEAIMLTNKSIKVVLKKSGVHKGEFRTQDLVHIAGENRKETTYLENGIRLIINPETVYFSARLSTEREELMKDLGEKKVLVMFSGAGPYTFVALKKQPNLKRVVNIEINPEGYKYSLESLELNKNIIKKAKLYEKIVEFLKNNELPIYEKRLLQILNKLRVIFINGDVRVEVENLGLKKEVRKNLKFNNEIFDGSIRKVFDILMNYDAKELILDIDLLDKKVILPFLILFSEKYDFVCKIEGKNYIFNDNLSKSYLINYLENNEKIEKMILYDEIFMPLPKDAELFLDCAFKVADKGCIIHMYDFVHENEFPQKSENSVMQAAMKYSKKVEILQTRKVGQYSPRKYRVCCDFIVK